MYLHVCIRIHIDRHIDVDILTDPDLCTYARTYTVCTRIYYYYHFILMLIYFLRYKHYIYIHLYVLYIEALYRNTFRQRFAGPFRHLTPFGRGHLRSPQALLSVMTGVVSDHIQYVREVNL